MPDAYSVGANATHGLRRTNADKRRAVETLLRDEEWGAKSDRWIAEKCGVGNQLVGHIRRELCESHSSTTTTARTGRDGKTRRASNGKASASEPPPEPLATDPEPPADDEAEPESDEAPAGDEPAAYAPFASGGNSAVIPITALLRLRAQRQAGELLAETVQHGGDRRSSSQRENLKLAELGVDHNQSHRWQRIAAMPADGCRRRPSGKRGATARIGRSLAGASDGSISALENAIPREVRKGRAVGRRRRFDLLTFRSSHHEGDHDVSDLFGRFGFGAALPCRLLLHRRRFQH